MDNYEFIRDYSENAKEKEIEALNEISTNYPLKLFAQFYDRYIKYLPKVVIPKDKETFDRLVPKLDEFVKKRNGSIYAKIDYEKYECKIDVYLRNLSIKDAETRELFKDIAENATEFIIKPADNERIHLLIFIYYFKDIEPDNLDEILEISDKVADEMKRDGYYFFGEMGYE